MAWCQRKNGKSVVGDTNSATDGDLDIAYSLGLASKQWNWDKKYLQEYLSILGNIKKFCFNKNTFHPLLGDWVDSNSHYYKLTRPSDFMLAYFYEFSKIDADGFWVQVIQRIINTLSSLVVTYKLIPDFLQLNGNNDYIAPLGEVLESEHDKNYYWNSCRVPWRLLEYYIVSGDQKILKILYHLIDFFKSQDRFYTGYTLDGNKINNYESIAFTEPILFLLNYFNIKQNYKRELLYNKEYFGDTIYMLIKSINLKSSRT